jgi:hypothetical protein
MKFKIIPIRLQNLLQQKYSQSKSKRDQEDHTICLYILEKQDDKATFTAVGTRSQKISHT